MLHETFEITVWCKNGHKKIITNKNIHEYLNAYELDYGGPIGIYLTWKCPECDAECDLDLVEV